jgi:hypothetical protein
MRQRASAMALLLAAGCGLTLTAARADDMPSRKPGLWEVTMTRAGVPSSIQSKYCIDAATDAALYKMGLSASDSMCTRRDIRRNGNVVTVDSVCKMGETQMTSHSVLTYTGDAAYRNETQTRYNPPLMGRTESAMTQDAKWVGPCPSDMKPGDVLMPGGMKINIIEASPTKP